MASARTSAELGATARRTSVTGAAWFSGFGHWPGGSSNGYNHAACDRALPESFGCKR